MFWALEYNYTVVIHCRNAFDEIFSILKSFDKLPKGIFHCFSGSEESARQIIDAGFYLGIGGVLTYKNAGLQEVVKNIGLQHLVLETDAPYLTPVPHRGKRNESAYVRFVADEIAYILGKSVSEVANVTTVNAETLFR